ncbi:hypothetical protein [Luteipulveratus mongoliensis]|uniref:Uncharacterized protein n=1 Tax=Luteipulveratus mongoliensis TaxID=571913 RepID=A0A0K1JIU2_9MICO|nr:hypothetical protein [Luteipulveratus mongoliensis]AKU16632.1 hypothetical protein VV02_13430 [Luteipulveratus mongoliensis]
MAALERLIAHLDDSEEIAAVLCRGGIRFTVQREAGPVEVTWLVSDQAYAQLEYRYAKESRAAMGRSNGAALLSINIEEVLLTCAGGGQLHHTATGFEVRS